ncbi:MAG: hypothetical protein IKR17_01590 [Bacteroidales bacterium]|nr:hypothetical protein [Bacteroidales bacterium]
MGLSFFKVPKPHQFTYVPRYYDPEKERRDEIRRELEKESPEAGKDTYVPGDLIRNVGFKARHDRFDADSHHKTLRRRSQLLTMAILVTLMVLGYYMFRDFLPEFKTALFGK